MGKKEGRPHNESTKALLKQASQKGIAVVAEIKSAKTSALLGKNHSVQLQAFVGLGMSDSEIAETISTEEITVREDWVRNRRLEAGITRSPEVVNELRARRNRMVASKNLDKIKKASEKGNQAKIERWEKEIERDFGYNPKARLTGMLNEMGINGIAREMGMKRFKVRKILIHYGLLQKKGRGSGAKPAFIKSNEVEPAGGWFTPTREEMRVFKPLVDPEEAAQLSREELEAKQIEAFQKRMEVKRERVIYEQK